jgi:hypothetical protein
MKTEKSTEENIEMKENMTYKLREMKKRRLKYSKKKSLENIIQSIIEEKRISK